MYCLAGKKKSLLLHRVVEFVNRSVIHLHVQVMSRDMCWWRHAQCPFVWKLNQQFLGNVSNLAQTSPSFTCKVLMCLEQTYEDIFVWIYSDISYGSVFSTHNIQETHDNAIAFPLQLRTSQTQPCKHLHDRLGSGSLVNHPDSMQ